MAEKEPTNVSKAHDAQLGESDDFILPVAPPSQTNHEPLPRTEPASRWEPSSATNAIGDASPVASEPHHFPTKTPPDLENEDKMVKSNPRPLVVLLVCLIVGFLFVIVNMFNKAEPKMNSVIASSEIDEPDLNSVQINAGVLQSNSTEMEGRINELEQQLAAERIETNAKLEALAREKKALEIRGSDLLAQLDRSQKQLQTTTSQTTPTYEPEQKASVNPINNTRYRVTRLANGDTLNLRAGPGANYAIVVSLYNGAEILVTGDSVRNEQDAWLPCSLEVNSKDPRTGLRKIIKRTGWVNSYFVEPVPTR